MAATVFSFAVSSNPLVAATPKTVSQVKAPANQRVRILKYGFSLDGVTNTAIPVRLRVLRQSTAGTSMVVATARLHEGDLTMTPNTVVQTGAAGAQTEPTLTSIVYEMVIHPQGGSYNEIAVQGQELIVPPGGYIGFELTAPAGVNVSGVVTCEE